MMFYIWVINYKKKLCVHTMSLSYSKLHVHAEAPLAGPLESPGPLNSTFPA